MVESYEELWQWSIDHIGAFWGRVWEFCGIVHSRPYERVVDESARIDDIPEWFPGARLNFAENLLRPSDPAATALVFANETWADHGVLRWTRARLQAEVGAVAAALRSAGIREGDVVAMWCPNVPEAVAFTLAVASIGAIVTAVSPDFGHQSVLDRFQQTEPRLLLTANAVLYNSKIHQHWPKVEALLAECPSIRRVVWLDYIAGEPGGVGCPKATSYASFVEGCHGKPLEFAQLPFSHPLYILYSSGTTGKPKCIVHSAGGTLIQHLKEHVLHGDLTHQDRLLQYTTVGWMMWQWMVTPLALGTTLVLYDGSPFKPDDQSLLGLLAHVGVTAFGTSAKYLQRLEETHCAPRGLGLDLAALKQIFSTGSPLPGHTFEWVAEAFGGPRIASITGGTDIISLFAGGNPTQPVWSGLIQSRCLGMAVYAVDQAGTPVTDEPGDLICTRPFPSMPVFFWRDSPRGSESLYQQAYFRTIPGIWHHGDFVQIDSRHGNGLLMLGRSDGTLNPAGVRFGSADLYAVVGRLPKEPWGILDSLAVGVRRQDEPDERVVLFLHLRPGHPLTPDLVSHLKDVVRKELSPRHVPALVLEAPEIPYTVNGKKVEVAVKRILSGLPGVSTSSLANPEALDYFRSLRL